MSDVRARYRIDPKPLEEMDMTITFTMPIRTWRALMKDQPNKWPHCDLSQIITDMLADLSRATDKEHSRG